MSAFQPQLDWLAAQADAMTAQVAGWAEISSGSRDPAGLDRLRARLAADFGQLPAAVEELPLPTAPGEPPRFALRLRCRREAPLQVLLAGHYDTVFGPEHPFREVRRPTAGDPLLRGPGVADMKGGLAVLLFALRAFEAAPGIENLGWEVLLNPDEELGSPGSRGLLNDAARRHQLGLVFEPALPGGGLASARKGSGNFTAAVHGRAAHAGRDLAAGRNAVVALAEFLVGVDRLNGERAGVTFNVGSVAGGGPANIVPDRAGGEFNVRTVRAEDEAWVRARLDELAANVNAREGFRLRIEGGFTSPPKPADPAVDHLLRGLGACAEELGFPLGWGPTGGTCDGNRLFAAGLPNVDNLGPRGGGLHSADEFIDPRSLPERARLTALFLGKLATGVFPPPTRA